MRLGRQVVEFVGLHLLDDPHQAGGVGHVSVVQDELAVVDVGILVEMIDAVGVEQRGAPFDAVDFVAFFQQKLGQVGAVLSGHPGDQCFFVHRETTSFFLKDGQGLGL